MPYCPHCGGEVEHAIEIASPVEEAVSAEVEIARINAERDVKVAQIQSRQDANWNETQVEVAEVEAEAEVATAEATAEIIGEVLAAEGGEPEADPAAAEGGDPDPVVVVEAPDPGPEVPAPPQLEETKPETKKSPGYWDGYR